MSLGSWDSKVPIYPSLFPHYNSPAPPPHSRSWPKLNAKRLQQRHLSPQSNRPNLSNLHPRSSNTRDCTAPSVRQTRIRYWEALRSLNCCDSQRRASSDDGGSVYLSHYEGGILGRPAAAFGGVDEANFTTRSSAISKRTLISVGTNPGSAFSNVSRN